MSTTPTEGAGSVPDDAPGDKQLIRVFTKVRDAIGVTFRAIHRTEPYAEALATLPLRPNLRE